MISLYDKFNVDYDNHHFHHYHHLSLNREGRWGTTDDFETRFLHSFQFSTALPPFTVPCKMLLVRPENLQQIVNSL